ncbi:response regulator c-di-GMP phosphodiesterase, RpfG family [Arcobacter venerupis]|uniref:Response regulator c-di-GMP phosphodiesterase, RpfG family n=1 Tax=Arcobacter venerupis TaxID=1054033 RepID=A0AAE7BE46_9BACT|nr:response regulator c-di-GMP phosphodiesterase, RpfG family [Arcobacter venerupis]RWS48688.1 HD family phosphohydrolase [Arcobacter venerupis]
MSIKKIVKFSFILILFIIAIIGIINTIVIYQIKENNLAKQSINNLVSMQERMNELLKDTITLDSIVELDKAKEDFVKYELEFEKIQETFKEQDKNDLIDFFITGINKDEVIAKRLELLFKSEQEIEKAFDSIYLLQESKIELLEQFNSDYPIENEIRKKIDHEIIEQKDFKLSQLFGDVKYYSKEVLYQKRDRETFEKWLGKIQLLKNSYDNVDTQKYLQIVEKVGTQSVKIKDIEDKEFEIRNISLNIININKNYSFEIEEKIEKLSSNFINITYISILILLIIVISFLTLLAYKVYKNVGLSVDEIETKIEDGLIEITKLNQEIEKTQKEVVFTMGAIGESRSKETGNHVKRVAEYSKLLALYYGLDEKEAEMLKQASPMHDIGKVAIPDAILNKPGRFDEAEREIMNTHAALGYEMLKHSDRPLLKMAAIVANEHHEKWDGSGYPRGASGEDIHIYGRITALADVFDALGSDRVYKEAWNDEKIFNLFKEEKGKHFDPKLVDIFFEHLDEFLKIRETFKDKF